METENKAMKSGGKTILIVTVVLIAAFIVYFSIMSLFSPGKMLAEIKEKYGIQQSEDSPADERLFADSAYHSLLKQRAFLQARIAMAETDSVSLSLNLSDSTAILEISGVTVHTAKMNKIETSRLLYSGDVNFITYMLATPGNIIRDFATIKKEPLMVKMAPKDTSEFKPDIIPDTSDYEAVGYILEMERGLRIFVYQDEEINASDRRQLFMFDLNDRLRNLGSSLADVVLLKVPDYRPFIRIRLPKADAKIIYRAIPRKGQIAVFL